MAGQRIYVEVDGDEYLASTLEMTQPAGPDEQLLSPQEITDFLSVAAEKLSHPEGVFNTDEKRLICSQVGYMSNDFCLELASECPLLGRCSFAPAIGRARIAIKLLTWANVTPYALMLRKGYSNTLTVFCDSAGRAEQLVRPGRGGRLIALTDADSHFMCGVVFWESKKVKRVCKATITGETLLAGEGHELHALPLPTAFHSLEAGTWISAIWRDITGKTLRMRMVVLP